MFYEDINIDYKPVHKTKEPETLFVEICDTFQETNDSFHCFYCLWSYLQKTPKKTNKKSKQKKTKQKNKQNKTKQKNKQKKNKQKNKQKKQNKKTNKKQNKTKQKKKKKGFDQIAPVFKGWMFRIRSLDQQDITKTVESYQPPIASKVIDLETMQQYLSYFQTLAKAVGCHM